ncbi:MAG: hypothetical protein IT366_21565 [Candidatus Hydrogenedentes bacterium]|nr:hypothetical protein [Candidatus Hydrogenedentota bacterium]
MAVTGVVATGTTYSFSGITYKAKAIRWRGIQREAINASKLTTTSWHDFTPANLVDPGEIEIETEGDGTFPSFGNAGTLTITYPNAAARSVSAFVISSEQTAELETLITGTVVFKCTGAIT